MQEDLQDSFFTQHGHFVVANSANALPSFYHHDTTLQLITDILGRKEEHHLICHNPFSPALQTYFLETLLTFIAKENASRHLQQLVCLFLNIDHVVVTAENYSELANEFQRLISLLEAQQKNCLLALTRASIFSHPQHFFLQQLIQQLISHPRFRILIFNNEKIACGLSFDEVHLPRLTESESLQLLTRHAASLSQYHHVTIAAEILPQSYALARRFLSTEKSLEKTIQLLDSAAARASALPTIHQGETFKSVLSPTVLKNVLATITDIPASHLQLSPFKLHDFCEKLQQRIFGQEAAVLSVARALQQAFAQVQTYPGPLCSFLFVGKEHCGKKTLALALVEQLFKQTNLLFIVSVKNKTDSILMLPVRRSLDNKQYQLQDVLQQFPCAVLMFDDAAMLSDQQLVELREVLMNGWMQDAAQRTYHFNQAIIILRTYLAGQRLQQIFKSQTPEHDHHEIDLMQLVLGKHSQLNHPKENISTQEIVADIKPLLAEKFEVILTNQLHIIPFAPLTAVTLEKILRYKLGVLNKQLVKRYGIEFTYAQEVISFLLNDIPENEEAKVSLAIKRLYCCIEEAMLARPENKARFNRLFLQLNDTGELLRGDWLELSSARHHAS